MNTFKILFVTLTAALASVTVTPAVAAERKPSAAKPDARVQSGKIDLNTASIETLQSLPGVGAQTAKAIVAARPFASVADLEAVPGIGPAKMADLSGQVTVSKTTAATKSDEKKPARTMADQTPGERQGTAVSVPPKNAPRVDINTADAETLETLPGVGGHTAQAIIAARPFASIEDLERVPGIGAVKLADMRPYVRVGASLSKDTTASTRTVTARSGSDRSASSREASRDATRTSTGSGRELEPTGRASAPKPAKIDLNTASRSDLEALPEIGPIKAQAIIEARPFTKIEEVMKVKGIKEGTFEVIKDQITVR